MFGGQFGDCSQFGVGIDDSGGIAGAVEQNHFGAGGDCRGDSLEIKLKIWVGVDRYGDAAGEADQRGVHDEVGVEKDNFVPGIDHRQHGQHQSAAGAAADENLAVGVCKALVDIGLQALAKGANSLGLRVTVAAAVNCLAASLANFRRDIKIGLTDGEVNGVGQLGG